MKLITNINGTNVILTPEQMDAISEILDASSVLENKYLGAGLGTNGGNYLEVLTPIKLHDVLKPGVMSDTSYAALVFITKQQEGKK